MSEFGLVVLFYVVCWQINKFKKQKVQVRQDYVFRILVFDNF